MTDVTYRIADLPPELAGLITRDVCTGCWLWGGRLNPSGYGQVNWDKRKQVVHRVVYTLLVGPIPPRLVLDHVHAWGCRHRRCCWPGHLEPVTIGENNRRGREATADRQHDYFRLPTIETLAELIIPAFGP